MIIKRIIIGLLLLTILFPIYGYANAQPAYLTRVYLIQNINYPWIVGWDLGLLHFYFVEDFNKIKYVHVFPYSSVIYTSSGILKNVEIGGGYRSYDTFIYFIEETNFNTVLKQCKTIYFHQCLTLSTLYKVPLNYQTVDLEVYSRYSFKQLAFISMYRVTPSFETRIIGVQYPSKTTYLVQSHTSTSFIRISNLHFGFKLSTGRIFVGKPLIKPVWVYTLDDWGSGTSSIMVKVGNKQPMTIISRPFNYAGLGNGRFTYLKKLDDTIYYIYTEGDSVMSNGYLEIGKITNFYQGTPTINVIYSNYFPYSIRGWVGNVDRFMNVFPSQSTIGGYEIFTSLMFEDSLGIRYRLLRFYGNPMTLQVIEESGPGSVFDYYSFIIMSDGSLIYGSMNASAIIWAER